MQERGARGTLVDLDTGKVVPRVIRIESTAQRNWDADGNLLVVGYIQAVWVDAFGRDICDDGHPRVYRAKGRFKFLPETAATVNVVLGAPACVKCGSTLTLTGEELCPRCRAVDRNQRCRFEALAIPLLGTHCEVCGAVARFSTSDEIIVSPSAARIRLDPERTHSRVHHHYFERGMTVARRYYCQRHWQPPRILDAKGEVVETLERS